MTDEPIKRYCCVCGKLIPSNLPVKELIKFGAASERPDLGYLYHCVARHTREQIEKAAANPPTFHRGSERQK